MPEYRITSSVRTAIFRGRSRLTAPTITLRWNRQSSLLTVTTLSFGSVIAR